MKILLYYFLWEHIMFDKLSLYFFYLIYLLLFVLLFFSRCIYILIFSLLIIFCASCSTPQYIASTQIKPIYPQMRECPNLPQATQITYWQIVNVDVPAMYYQCKADHDAVMQWINEQRNK